MGELADYIRLYIEDSDFLEDKLTEIKVNLRFNIREELDSSKPKPNGFIHGNLHDSVQSDIESRSQLKAIIRAYAKEEYAPWVNEGHDQQPGRFIPGEWKGDRFIYDPDAKTGMVLKKSHVEGLHFLEHGLEKTVRMYQ